MEHVKVFGEGDEEQQIYQKALNKLLEAISNNDIDTVRKVCGVFEPQTPEVRQANPKSPEPQAKSRKRWKEIRAEYKNVFTEIFGLCRKGIEYENAIQKWSNE